MTGHKYTSSFRVLSCCSNIFRAKCRSELKWIINIAISEMYAIHQKQRGRNSLSLVCKRDWIINGLEGEHIFSRAKHHERAIIPARWQMKRMVHLYGTSFSNLPSDNKPNRISYFSSASKFLWQFNYLCWISLDGSFVSEKLEVWVMKQKLHAKNIRARDAHTCTGCRMDGMRKKV